MVQNKRSVEGTQLSGETVKSRHVHNKYQDGASEAELSDDNKKYFIDDAETIHLKDLAANNKSTSKLHTTNSSKSTKSKRSTTTSKQLQQQHTVGGFKHNRKWVQTIAVFFALYYCAQMFYRHQHRGVIGFADTFWLCNFTLIFGILAVILDKPYMMGMAVSCTAIVHSLWTIDAICGLTTGNFPIGNSEYIVWPHITWGEILTTTHHVWFVPLAIFTLHKNGGYPKRSWLGCVILLAPVLYISSLFPKTIKLADGTDFYLNINLIHEWWSDVRGWPFSLIPQEPQQPYSHYLTFFVSFCIVLFVITHNVMKAVSHLFIDKN